MNPLIKLSLWLRKNKLFKEAQIVENLKVNEDWYDEASKEFGEEPISEDEYFSQNFEADEKNVSSDLGNKGQYSSKQVIKLYHDIVKKEGFKLSFHESFAGGGAFGKVFQGVYQGKPSVIKIIIPGLYHEVPENELENWKKILQAAETMPPEYSKYIPEIYKTNQDSVEVNDEAKEDVFINNALKGDKIYYDALIMEQLHPLNPSLKRLISGVGGGDYIRALNKALKDPEYLYEIAKEIINYNYEELPENVSAPDLLKYLMSGNLIYNHDLSRQLLIRTVEYLEGNFEFEVNNNLMIVINRVIKPFVEPQSIVRNQYDLSKSHAIFWKYIPETKTLIEALEYITKSTNLSWRDIHRGNVMLDNKGNIKIIDVGLYLDLSDQ